MGNNGGARPGAGRPPKSPTLIKTDFAKDLLRKIKSEEIWERLLTSPGIIKFACPCGCGKTYDVEYPCPDAGAVLKGLMYLTDRAEGKAPQGIQLSDPSGGPAALSFVWNGPKPPWADPKK